MREGRYHERALAGALGALLTLGALGTAAIVLLLGAIAAQPPDARAPDGDPCCPVPDSWMAVAGWCVAALACAAAVGAGFALGVALLHRAVVLRWPDRRLARMPLYAASAFAVLLAGLLLVRLV